MAALRFRTCFPVVKSWDARNGYVPVTLREARSAYIPVALREAMDISLCIPVTLGEAMMPIGDARNAYVPVTLREARTAYIPLLHASSYRTVFVWSQV